MPYLSSGVPAREASLTSDYLFYMRPSYTQAMIGVMRYYKWTHVFYVYDDVEGGWNGYLLILQGKKFSYENFGIFLVLDNILRVLVVCECIIF